MEINFVKQRKDADRISLENTSFLKDAVGFWGNVCDVDSTINSVDVISDTGITYKGIPVYSKEWVNKDDKQNYTTGSRNLPPNGARVFVLAPTHTIAGAFVLCSGYAKGDTKKQTLYAESDKSGKDKKEKNTVEESVLMGGWKFKNDYSNGNISISNADDTIQFSIINKDEEETKKSISITSFNHSVTLENQKVTLQDSNGNKVETDNTGLKITDKNGNTFTASSTGWDLNGHLTIQKPTTTTTTVEV